MLKAWFVLETLKEKIPEKLPDKHHITLNDNILQIMVMGEKGPMSVLVPLSEFSSSAAEIVKGIKKLYSAL